MTALPCCAEMISLWAANATPDNGRDGDGDRVVGRNGIADATAPVIIPKSFAMAPPTRPDWLGLTEGRPATPLSILSPQRPATTFFRRLRLCIANQKSRLRPPSTSFQPFGCGSIASGLTTAIGSRWARP